MPCCLSLANFSHLSNFIALDDHHKLDSCIAEFNLNSILVQATMPMVPWPGDPNSQAVIFQIKDANYGLIEIKCAAGEKLSSFFCLFHKDQVSLVIFNSLFLGEVGIAAAL